MRCGADVRWCRGGAGNVWVTSGGRFRMTFSFYWVCVQEDSKEKGKKSSKLRPAAQARTVVVLNMIDGVIELLRQMIMFKVHVRDVKLTLDCLKPVVQEISEYNKLLNNLPMEEELAWQDLKLQMEEGANLVRKCSKVGAWSFCKKYKYSNQLFQLDQSLQTLLHLLEVQKTRDVQETLVSVKNIETVVQRIEGNISAMQSNQSATY